MEFFLLLFHPSSSTTHAHNFVCQNCIRLFVLCAHYFNIKNSSMRCGVYTGFWSQFSEERWNVDTYLKNKQQQRRQQQQGSTKLKFTMKNNISIESTWHKSLGPHGNIANKAQNCTQKWNGKTSQQPNNQQTAAVAVNVYKCKSFLFMCIANGMNANKIKSMA